jgi:hypothetical protein
MCGEPVGGARNDAAHGLSGYFFDFPFVSGVARLVRRALCRLG